MLLLGGLLLFCAIIIRLVWLAVQLRKFKEVVIPYLRLLFFVFIYFLVFCLFLAWEINDGANESNIVSGYEAYFNCLAGLVWPPSNAPCVLSDTVSNYNLVMLKGFAVSCLGFLIFFNFISWGVVKQLGYICIALFHFLKTRDKNTAMRMLGVFVHEAGRSSPTGSLSQVSLEMNQVPEPAVEEEEEEEKEEEGSKDSSSSSGD